MGTHRAFGRGVVRTTVLLISTAMALIGGAVGISGCSHEDEATSSSENHFTVSNGHAFIVSAQPEHVVLRKEVDGAVFPFDAAALQGKAILIHPIAGKADDGIFSRVNRVTDDAGHFVVEATPLTFAEMARVTEDQIVRIYIEPSQAAPNASRLVPLAHAPPLAPRDFDLGAAMNVRPQASGAGLPFGSFGADEALNQFATANPYVSFRQTIQQASFRPNVLFDWSSETGLEVGFRADIDWKSEATLRGSLTGEFFRSNAYEAFGAWVYVPVGIVPIPIKAGVRLRIQCKATLTGPASMLLDVETHAHVGGSFRVRPTTDTAPAQWVSQGSWPAEATGSASVTPTFELAVDGSVSCALPRIELHTQVFGVVGPVAVVSPTAVVDSDGVHPELRFSAGIAGGLFGVGTETGIEVPLYTLRF